jgi:hypothetical protein
MNTPSIRDDPAHWRRRAQEARRLADQLDDPITKQTMLDIARSYEQLATLAETKRAPKT